MLPGLLVIALLGGCAGHLPWRMGNGSSSWQAGSNMQSAHQLSNFVPRSTPTRPQPTGGIQLVQAEDAEDLESGGTSLELEQVRCQAALSAILGQLTEIERGLAAEFYNENRCISPNLKSLQQELLMLRTAVMGNEAAASALEVYLQWAEAESQKPLLDASLREIQSMRDDLQELKQRGLPVEEEPATLDRQYLSTRERRETLDAGIAQARLKLQVLLGDEGGSRFTPRVELESELPLAFPDRAQAVQVALSMRPELRSLRTMIHRIAPDTLPLARAVLQQYEGSLGTVQPVGIGLTLQQNLGWILFWGADRCPLPAQVREVEVRRVQLVKLLHNREIAITAEVDAALIAGRSALEKRESAKQRAASWKEELDRLTQLQPVDETITSFDLAQVRLGILEAKSDLLRITIEGLQAQVSLWTAQGVTGAGCGLPGHEPFWCESCQTTHGLSQPEPPPSPMSEAMRLRASNIVPVNFRPSSEPGELGQACRPVRKGPR